MSCKGGFPLSQFFVINGREFNWLYARKIKKEEKYGRLASGEKVECGLTFSADARRSYIFFLFHARKAS